MKISKNFYLALCVWNHAKNLTTFMQLYHNGFDKGSFCLFRVYRIIRNTLQGRYKKIENQVKKGEIIVKES